VVRAGTPRAGIARVAAIDALLRIMILRDAEAMVLIAGQPPKMRRRGQLEPLLMPALDAGMLATFVDEVVPADRRAHASVSVVHAHDGLAFPITVETTAAGPKLSIRAPGKTAPAPARTPLPAAALGVTPEAVAPAPAPVTPATRSESESEPEPASRAPTPRLLGLLAEAAASGASDLLLSEGRPPRVRVDGELRGVSDDDPVTADELAGLAGALPGGSADFALALPSGGRVRANVFRHDGGLGAALRLIRDRAPSLRELGLPDLVDGAVRHPNGLVLVCGPTGSGKSTTLVALLDELDRHRAAHVITLEDPIEYRITPRRCLVHQREVGTHVASFAAGLRAALREAPDVIVVGELRDPETIAIALTAAETGHLVLATLHAPHAVGAIDRVIDAFPDAQQRQARTQLAAALRVIITQHLVPRRAGGRVVAVEHVPATAAATNLIRKGELHLLPTHIQAGRDLGMVPLERSLAALVKRGEIAAPVARRIAHEPELFEAALR
jgi:twitching motility protein PilT